jgi:hypothetical protein
MEAKAEKITHMPVQDKYKDMDFTQVKNSYDNLKTLKNRIKMMPKDSTGEVDLTNV